MPEGVSQVKLAKKRVDDILVDRGFCPSREKARARILAREIWAQGQCLDKPGKRIDENIELSLTPTKDIFVSRGGHKLAQAIQSFGIQVARKICLDVGASTGGFTDCLLQNGAEHVFAVDVGYGHFASSLRKDPRVSLLERINARYLTKQELLKFGSHLIQLIVIDVSFISLRTLIPPLLSEFAPREWVLLFKPQFEVGREFVRKGGVVKDEETIRTSLGAFSQWMQSQGFKERGGPEPSNIKGKKSGNVEYLFYYEWDALH